MRTALEEPGVWLIAALVLLSITAAGCGQVLGCDDKGTHPVTLTVVNQAGEPLDVSQVSWTSTNGRQGDAACYGLDDAPCSQWIIGRDNRGNHDADFDITVQCGSETQTKTVHAEGDYCHWNTTQSTITFDDLSTCETSS